MAEIGLLASIVQVADIGLRLSLRLYAFGETVASADRSISAISNDVSLTSSVLKELGDLLKSDTSRIYSDNAVKTADAVVRECSKAFTEMDEMLLKKVPQLHTGDVAKQSRASLILERLRWPAIKGKIELLRVNLDRMKSTLTLMLNVIIYAKQVSERKEAPSILSDQRQLIEDLANANQDREREFNELRLVLGRTHIDQAIPVTTSKSSPSFGTSFVALPQRISHGAEISTGRKRRFMDPTSPSASEAPPMTGPAVRLLLDEFTKLHSRLLTEVRSTDYKIESGSRARYESDITSRHNQEIQVACKSEQKDSETDSFTAQLIGKRSLGSPRRADVAAHANHVDQGRDADDAKLLFELSRISQSEAKAARAISYQRPRSPCPLYDPDITGSHAREAPVAYKSEQDRVHSKDLESVAKLQTSSKRKKRNTLQAGAAHGSGPYHDDEERSPPQLLQDITVDPANASDLPPSFGGQNEGSIDVPKLLNSYQHHFDVVGGIPVDVRAPPRTADEKRKRNATASHRFRKRREEKEKEAASNITRLEQQAKDMADQRDSYRQERDALQDALIRHTTSFSTSNMSPDEWLKLNNPDPTPIHQEEPEEDCEVEYEVEYEDVCEEDYEERMVMEETTVNHNEKKEQDLPIHNADQAPATYASALQFHEQQDPPIYAHQALPEYASEPQSLIRRAFDMQMGSIGDQRAASTSGGLRLSKDIMTVDRLISRWTNLGSSSLQDSLPLCSMQCPNVASISAHSMATAASI